MNNRLKALSTRIRGNLSDLERVTERVLDIWQRAKTSGDDYYLDSVALNLHDFYSGLERIFELIAENVDGSLPGGEGWHISLLQRMTEEVPVTRPAVISDQVFQQLNEYRGFRHVVRNVYTFRFDPIKIEKLVTSLPVCFTGVKAELSAFANFLEERA